MERELTVRHVFVGFVEGKESGIRNPESGMRNSQPFQCHLLEHIVLFYTFFISRNSIRITLTLQYIKQNVSESLASYSNVPSAATAAT